MTLTSLTCPRPVRRSSRPTALDFDLLDAAVRLFDEGKPLQSLEKVFEHLFPGHPTVDLAKEPFSFAQGSSRVTVSIENDELWVRVPFVHLAAGSNSTAALRYLLTRLSGSGQLHQPRLHGDDVHIEFHDRLSRLHPMKLLETLRQAPVQADQNDDWMADQFGVTPLLREPIESVSQDELDRSEIIWRAHFVEVEELLKESQRKRSMFFLNELSAYALYHLRFSLPLTGALHARIAESATTFNEPDLDPSKREAALAKCVKEMKAVTREELEKCLGHAVYSLNPLAEGTSATLTTCLGGEYKETLVKLRSAGKHIDAALALFGTYSYLLGRFAWSLEIEELLLAGLAQATGKPWREAASELLLQAKEILDAIEEDEDARESANEEQVAR